jgi:ribosome-associated heat shock protein Hsp15
LESVRIDKWLWAARFFKTRSLASTAVTGGKVHLNGARTKAAKAVVVGDVLEVRRLEEVYTIRVESLSDRRGPAKVAQTLYEETPQSIAARQAAREQRRINNLAAPAPQRRPDKKSRRLIHRFKQSGHE